MVATLVALVTAGTAREAYKRIEREQPDVAIVDYDLPDEDGLSLCCRLKRLPAPPRVLILSAFADDALAVMAVIAGADGVMSKASSANLHKTVAALAAGERLVPEISPLVLEAIGSKLDAEDLSILGMLIHGIPAADIAATLKDEPARLTARRRAMLERLAHPDSETKPPTIAP